MQSSTNLRRYPLRAWPIGAAVAVLVASLVVMPARAAPAARPWVAVLDSVVIEGVVVDAESGEPLQGVLVRIIELGRQDLTHPDGEFHLINLPAGRHTLLFERIGYRREVREVRADVGDVVQLHVAMRPSAIELPGLVVTGTVGARLGEEAVRPTTTLSGQELLRKLDQTLAASLRQEAGLSATSMGPATARPVIRGLGGDRVLILEDGVRVGDLSSSSPDHAVAVDPLNARRLEVVRGPAALLYGSNAIGGVINIIREEVPASRPDRPTGTLSMQAQSVNRGGALGGTVQAGIANIALRAEGTARRTGDLHVPPDTVLGNTSLRSYELSLGASAIEPWGYAGVAYRFYDNAYGVPGDTLFGHPFGVDVEMRRHSLHADVHHLPSGGPFTAVDLRAKYTHYYHREIEDIGVLGTEFGLLTGAAELVARHRHVGRLDDGAVGLRVQWQDFAAGGLIGTPPAKELGAAAFFLEELELGPFVVQFGGRYDWHRIEPLQPDPDSDIGHIRERTFGSVSGSLGVHYDFSHGWHLGASIARAYRTPNITELFSLGPHLAAYSFDVGNPDLAAEYGLGLDAFLRVGRDDLRGEFAVFRNALSNYIYYANTGSTTPDGLPIYQAVGRDALLSGAEASFEWSVVPAVVIEGTASYVRGTNRGTGEPLPQIPPLNGLVHVRYERPSHFVGAGWRGAAAQERVAFSEFETPTDGYGVFNIVAGYRWVAAGRIHNVTLRADNITNTLYRDHLSRVKHVLPEAGRNISLTYRLTY
jgi:iron complex outermembrane recepter protein